MRFPREIVKSVAVYHLPSSGATSYPDSPNATVQGAFLPMNDRQHALEGGVYVEPHELYVDPTVDIRTSDKLVIAGQTYYVMKVFNAQFGGLTHKRASISIQK